MIQRVGFRILRRQAHQRGILRARRSDVERRGDLSRERARQCGPLVRRRSGLKRLGPLERAGARVEHPRIEPDLRAVAQQRHRHHDGGAQLRDAAVIPLRRVAERLHGVARKHAQCANSSQGGNHFIVQRVGELDIRGHRARGGERQHRDRGDAPTLGGNRRVHLGRSRESVPLRSSDDRGHRSRPQPQPHPVPTRCRHASAGWRHRRWA